MAVVDCIIWFTVFRGNKLPHIMSAICGHAAHERTVAQGSVESIARGIYDRDNPQSRELIADVNPTFNWVRLAQRVPVRIHLDQVPEDVMLAAGLTCTVIVNPGRDD